MTNQQETKEQGELRFYYNREERLKKAGPLAQYTASLYTRKKPGIFASMTATGPLKFLFFSIIVLALLIFGYQVYQNFDKRSTIDGVKYSAQAMVFEKDLYLTIRRESTHLTDYQKQVLITVKYNGIETANAFPKNETEMGIKLSNVSGDTSKSIIIEIDQENKKSRMTITLR